MSHDLGFDLGTKLYVANFGSTQISVVDLESQENDFYMLMSCDTQQEYILVVKASKKRHCKPESKVLKAFYNPILLTFDMYAD